MHIDSQHVNGTIIHVFSPAEFSDLLPDDMIPKNYMTFRHVLPVSASTGFGIEHLKSCIRQSLDEDAEMETKVIRQERLQALRSHLH